VRYLFITSHRQDLRLFKHGGQRFWYGLLMVLLLLAPTMLGKFYLNELSNVLIFAVAGVGLMLLTGYTGLVSLGHGAFLGVGAYTNAFLLKAGVPFLLSFPIAGLTAGLFGVLLGFPVLRLTGVYLVMATYAFSLILHEVFATWVPVTGGLNGTRVPYPDLFGYEISSGPGLYYISLFVLVSIILVVVNLLRADTGRSLMAIRDSHIAAQSIGIHLTRYKTTAFGLSAAISGLAGALLGHRLGFISPEAFDFLMSLQLLLVVVVGGLGSIHGAIFGAIFIGVLPQAIALLRGHLPPAIAEQPSLDSGLFGLVLMLVVLFEPKGIYGVWIKIQLYFSQFPLYRRATFRRQKLYMRSERV
jgi:branched-chain amino acid transport system permease protein